MLQKEEIKTSEYCFLIRELICSIREINRRLNELNIIIQSDFCTNEGKKEVFERCVRLTETKRCLVESLKEVVNNITSSSINEELKKDLNSLFNDINLYQELELV